MAPVPGDSSKHQFGTQMPQGGHPPHHSITSSARTPSPPALHKPGGQARSVGRTVRLPQKGRLVLGTDLNRSESRFERFGPCSISREKIAQPTVWRPVGYGISTRAMLILELREPHAVRRGPLYPSKRACADLPQDARSAPGRNPSPGCQNAGSRTSCSCSLRFPISWRPLRVRASLGVSRQADERLGAWRGGNP